MSVPLFVVQARLSHRLFATLSDLPSTQLLALPHPSVPTTLTPTTTLVHGSRPADAYRVQLLDKQRYGLMQENL